VRKSTCSGIVLPFVLLATFQTTTRAQSPSSAQLATVKSFDLVTDQLISDFTGTDPAAVWELLKSSAALKDKSEFETKEAYKERLAHVADSPLAPGVAMSSLLAFMASKDLTVRYDADHREYRIQLPGQEIEVRRESWPGTDQYRTLKLRFDITRESSYTGENAMGATAQVSSTSANDYLLAYRKLPKGIAWVSDGSLLQADRELKLPMPPDEARAFDKANLRVLIIGSLMKPYSVANFTSASATLSDPTEVYVHDHILCVQVQAVWVYDIKTGRILIKFS
jgi:hypothetical protein